MNQTSEGSTIKDIVDEKFSAETQVLMMTFFGNIGCFLIAIWMFNRCRILRDDDKHFKQMFPEKHDEILGKKKSKDNSRPLNNEDSHK